jgi:prepilin-type N-terminal cleavage/methylation domain-containing protein
MTMGISSSIASSPASRADLPVRLDDGSHPGLLPHRAHWSLNRSAGLRPGTNPLRPGAGPSRPSPSAFSLVELMVVMALLSVIILGLVAMFTQTQRAFRTGMAQTDILASGRMATDMLARELQEITPSYLSRTNAPINIGPDFPTNGAPNFFTLLVGDSKQILPGTLLPPMPDRTNVLDDLFFLVRRNQTWTGIGYFVRTNHYLGTGTGPVGTLYRFETNQTTAQYEANPGGLFVGFLNACWTTNYHPGVSRILDGVVDFKVRAVDASGWSVTNDPAWWGNPVWNSSDNTSLPSMLLSSNLWVNHNGFATASRELGGCAFYSNAVPAFVDVELGILEPSVLDRYNSIPIANVRSNFLAGQVGSVHLFRQRIAVPNVDPAAYHPPTEPLANP